MKKTLIFEGAGWPKTESGDVGNCRIRTRIKTNDGRIVYLEMGCTPGANFRDCGFDNVLRVDHCHTDKKGGGSLRRLEGRVDYEYNQRNILKWVNDNLNCSFEELDVNNDDLRVHDTTEPLC